MTIRKKQKPFVKSASTDVGVDESREQIRALLKKYGATGFGVSEDYRTRRVTVSFVLPGDGSGFVPVQIPIDIGRVYSALYEGGQPNQYAKDPTYIAARHEQAERVAWRQLYLIIDATLTASSLGMVRISDVFMAHTMVVTDDGRTERMADYLDRVGGALAPGVRALLPAPKAEK